jgi:uncharacterized protein
MKLSIMLPQLSNTMQILKQDGLQLKNILSVFRNKEMCEVAVMSNGLALQYVPMKLRTRDLCKIAINGNGLALEFVPEYHRTYNLCMRAYGKNKTASKFYPKGFAPDVPAVMPTKKSNISVSKVMSFGISLTMVIIYLVVHNWK